MRWVFIRPCNKSPYYDPEIQEPLGLEYLSAARRSQGDQVLLLDSVLDALNDTRLARRAVSFMPDAIGFSIMTAQELDSVNAIYAECQRSLAGRPVLWLAGGNFISTEPDLACRLLPPNFMLVRGEGETALPVMAKSWPAVIAERANGMAAFPSDRTFTGVPVEKLDDLPFPDRPYVRQILGSGWAFNVQGARGCCGACRYCASPGMTGKKGGHRWRGRTPDHIVEEMAFLHKKFGARSFNFVDEDFLGYDHLTAGRVRAFTDALKRRRLDISFGIQVRPGSLSEETINLLVEAGLIYVFMGIESDNPEDFKRWRRPWIPDPWHLVRHIRNQGVGINAGVLLFHDHATLAGIRRFARKLHQHGLLDYRSVINRMDAMPGSFFYKRAMAAGMLNPFIAGPQHLPYIHPEVDPFYRDMAAAIEPLGPPSMHALCALPPLLAGRRFDDDPALDSHDLMRMIMSLDRAVSRTFFAVLDFHEHGKGDAGLISELRRKNLKKAVRSAKELVSYGFAPSYDDLREAIRMDSGL